MKTAVVILNWNGEGLLRQFLPSVIAHTTEPDTDIIVADNASSDNSLTLLQEVFPQVTIIRLDENYGFAEGYNRALAQLKADYFVLLNNDVEVSENWLSPLLQFLSDHPEVSAVQPKILKYRSTSFEYAGAAGGFLDYYGYPYCRGRLLSTIETDCGQYDEPIEVDWASGACLVIRAKDYRLAGGMDRRFFAHHEEIDLCWRLRVMGKRIFCVPESKVFHLGGASLPKEDPRKTYLNFRNNLTMIYKNMPQERLNSVLRMRCLLDNIAVFFSFVTGHVADARAILRARKDFNRWKKQFIEDRNTTQNTRLLPPNNDTKKIFLLWQYFVRNRKKWSSLPIMLLMLFLISSLSTLHKVCHENNYVLSLPIAYYEDDEEESPLGA